MIVKIDHLHSVFLCKTCCFYSIDDFLNLGLSLLLLVQWVPPPRLPEPHARGRGTGTLWDDWADLWSHFLLFFSPNTSYLPSLFYYKLWKPSSCASTTNSKPQIRARRHTRGPPEVHCCYIFARPGGRWKGKGERWQKAEENPCVNYNWVKKKSVFKMYNISRCFVILLNTLGMQLNSDMFHCDVVFSFFFVFITFHAILADLA